MGYVISQSHIVLALVQNLRPGGRFEQLNFVQNYMLWHVIEVICVGGKDVLRDVAIWLFAWIGKICPECGMDYLLGGKVCLDMI